MPLKNKLIIYCLVFVSIILSNCALKPPLKSTILSIKGSDTMQIMMERLAQSFMMKYPKISVYIEGGGTANGVEALIHGKTDICTASRLLVPEEASQIAQKYNSVGIYTLIAKDALSVYVNPTNSVRNLTLDQLKAIFTGKITNWKILGGIDQRINVLIRPPNSGTNRYFREHVLDNLNYYANAKTYSTTRQIVDQVASNPAAIGYGGIAYGVNVTHCSINGIEPTKKNVRSDQYPISRYLYLYTIRKPRGISQKFIDWVLSTEGQKIVNDIGYISLQPLEQ